MSQLLAISKNTFMQTVRQPIYGIIVLATLGGLALAPSMTGWTLDDDDKMLRDLGLSTLLVQGLFMACFAASTVLNAEIEDKTALTSAAKPVQRVILILGKYVGVFGALLVAHYMAGIAFFMIMRHGVLQTSSDTSDITVLIFGPGLMLLVLIAAGVANYVLDWRYLPSVIGLALPAATLGTLVLLVVDRDWKLNSFEVSQSMDNLPAEVVRDGALRDIIEIRPLEGHGVIEGNRARLVRSLWQGSISDDDRAYLLALAPDHRGWVIDVNLLIKACRTQMEGVEIFKAGVLIIGAIGLLTGIALVISTRFGMITTFVVCILAVGIGLTTDHYLLPRAHVANAEVERARQRAAAAESAGTVRPQAAEDAVDAPIPEDKNWADYAYALLPNFQMFWMVDALSDDRLIPWSYVGSAFSYAGLYILALLALAAALFETRELG